MDENESTIYYLFVEVILTHFFGKFLFTGRTSLSETIGARMQEFMSLLWEPPAIRLREGTPSCMFGRMDSGRFLITIRP
jgi:hypothetical protein